MKDKHGSSEEYTRVARLSTKELELPFKPFTINEVCEITGVSSVTVDTWIKEGVLLPYYIPNYGLDYMQTFAVFLGNEYLREGAPVWRATEVVRMISRCDDRWLNAECYYGRTFPMPAEVMRQNGVACPVSSVGIMVEPVNGVIGERLNTLTLSKKFAEQVTRVFPNSSGISWG